MGRRDVGVVVVVLVLVALAGVPSGTARLGGQVHTTQQIDPPQLGDAGIEPDGILLRADLQADGDAAWTVEYRVRLNDENTTAAFDSLRADIEANGTAYTTTFGERMEATARAAENATGREMTVRNVSVRATRQQLPQEYGVVTYRFEWTNFAAGTDGELRAGDALAGLFLDRQTTLVIGWPEEYGATTVAPTPDERRNDAVSWVGPTDFGAGEPAVGLSTDAAATGAPTTGDPGDGVDGSGDDAGGSTLLFVAVGLAAVAVVGVGVVLYRRRDGRDGDRGRVGTDPVGAGSGTAASGVDADESDTAGAADGDTTGEPTTEESDGKTDAGADDGPAPWNDELLSNVERVTVLLEHNDGRMKQQAIASELGWSDAKTSQVIGKMRDDDAVETFRLGRENVVSLPDSREP